MIRSPRPLLPALAALSLALALSSCATSYDDVRSPHDTRRMVPPNTDTMLYAEGCADSEKGAFAMASSLIGDQIIAHVKTQYAQERERRGFRTRETTLEVTHISSDLILPDIRILSSFGDATQEKTCVIASFDLLSARHRAERRIHILLDKLARDAKVATLERQPTRRLLAVLAYRKTMKALNRQAFLYQAFGGAHSFIPVELSGIHDFMVVRIVSGSGPLDTLAAATLATVLQKQGFIITTNDNAPFHLLLSTQGRWESDGRYLWLYSTLSLVLENGDERVVTLTTSFRDAGLNRKMVLSFFARDLSRVTLF